MTTNQQPTYTELAQQLADVREQLAELQTALLAIRPEIRKHTPEQRRRILDLGGGPGAFFTNNRPNLAILDEYLAALEFIRATLFRQDNPVDSRN